MSEIIIESVYGAGRMDGMSAALAAVKIERDYWKRMDSPDRVDALNYAGRAIERLLEQAEGGSDEQE